jgi:glutathione synthase/RimK-type ligase-like ATP-grasp enzyme
MNDLTLVTSSAHPTLPEDEGFLLRALERRGLRYRSAVWNDPAVDWSLTPLTVLRAAWDSHLDPPGFDRWLARPGIRLLNGAATLRWNFDKQYLVELQQRGFTVVPTALVPAPSGAAIEQTLREFAAQELVAKPRFGADAFGTARLPPTVDAVLAHFERFGVHGGLLLQPFIPAVERERERSLVYIGKRFSHALYRNPFGRGPTRQTADNVHTPTTEELDYSERLLGSLGDGLAYARVDLIPIGGRPTLMELELIDPSLFFQAQPAAAESLAEQIEIELARMTLPG